MALPRRPVTAQRPPRTHGQFWDTQPYRFKEELEARYTSAVLSATQRRAETIAAEGTAWMRQHAPWQDQTTDARKGLRAKVIKNKEDAQLYASLMSEARNQDAELKDILDRERLRRKEVAKARLALYEGGTYVATKIDIKLVRKGGKIHRYGKILEKKFVPPDPRKASRLRYNLKRQKQYKRVHTVPKGRSAVHQLETQWRGIRSPIVQVLFTHNTRLTYAIWLEIANQGRYAIISRAVNYWGKKMFAEIEQIARLKQYRDRINLGPERKTAGEEFFEYADRRTAQTGREYEAWSPTKRRERKERRENYDPEESKAAREATKAYRQVAGTDVRQYKEPEVQRMTVTTYNRRSGRK